MEQGHLLVSMMRKHSMMIILDCEQGPQIDVMMMSSTNPPGPVALRGVSIVLKLWEECATL